MKYSVDQLAAWGGAPLFQTPKPISNLPRPNIDVFLTYLKEAYYAGKMTGGSSLTSLLECRLADFHNVKHCVTFNSGFWALASLMRTIRISDREEVIMPSLTYRRMSDIAGWIGLKPRFCDVDPARLTNTAEFVLPCITAQTGLILGVHPINGLADIDGLSELAASRGIPLVFDSVESVYECHKGRRIGSFGDAEMFSLGASKLINGFEGGYITTNNAKLSNELRSTLKSPTDSSARFGFNGYLSEVHAAMALASLEDIDNQIIRNERRYRAYSRHLERVDGIRLLHFEKSERPSYKNIIAEILPSWPLTRDMTVELLNQEMVLARGYYPQPLHMRPMGFPHIPCSLPLTEELAQRFILLPCGELVSEEDIEKICDLVEFLAQTGAKLRKMREEGSFK